MEMMEAMEDLELKGSENVEQTTEETEETAAEDTAAEETADEQEAAGEQQPEKLFTQEDMSKAVGKAKARATTKAERETQKTYGELVSVLRAGTGMESIADITASFRDFYKQKGVELPAQAALSQQQAQLLGKAEAEEIIGAGYDEVVEEVNRLTKLGVEKMDAQQLELFQTLAKHRQSVERSQALEAIGVKPEVYNGKEFQDFAAMFANTTPITKVYEMFARSQRPKAVSIGSKKNGSHPEGKTFYTPEEVDKLTSKDLDDPVVFQRVRDSMKRW